MRLERLKKKSVPNITHQARGVASILLAPGIIDWTSDLNRPQDCEAAVYQNNLQGAVAAGNQEAL